MKTPFKLSILAFALMGALYAVNQHPSPMVGSSGLMRDCCGDPPPCPDPFNPFCPVGNLQAK